MPNVLTAEALRKLNVPVEKFNASFEGMMRTGIERLLGFQTPRGGWSWYGGSEDDFFMTACVVRGLSECERLGYKVDAVALKRGRERLRVLAKEEKNPNLLAYAAHALGAEFEPLLPKADALSPYAQALLVLTLHKAGRPEAAGVARMLAARAKNDHWDTADWHQRWDNVSIETTAYAIQALVAVDSQNPLIHRAAAWLLEQRQGNRWRSTKDTAAAIVSLLQVTALGEVGRAVEGEGKPATARPALLRKVAVRLNDGERREISIDLNNPLQSVFEAHFPRVRPGMNALAFERVDEQADFDFEMEFGMRVFESGARAASRGVSVEVTYDRPLAGLRLGEEVEATVTVGAASAVDYAMALSPIPAGCEIIRGSGQGEFERFEERYEKAIFFLRSLGEGPRQLRYRMRAAFAGKFTVLPAWAGLMYNEEVFGSGGIASGTIEP